MSEVDLVKSNNLDKSSFVSEQVTVIEKGYKEQVDTLQTELARVSQSYEERLSLMSEEYNIYRSKWVDAEVELEKAIRTNPSHGSSPGNQGIKEYNYKGQSG